MRLWILVGVLISYTSSAYSSDVCEREYSLANTELLSIGELYSSGAMLSLQKLRIDYEMLSNVISNLDLCLLKQKSNRYSEQYTDLFILSTDYSYCLSFQKKKVLWIQL